MKSKFDFGAMVAALTKPGEQLQLEATPQKMHLNHMAIGVSGEVGELLDAIKKHTVYGRAVDMDNVREELGDLEFYLEGIRASLGITREETLEHCRIKLAARYNAGRYTDQAAAERMDKILDQIWKGIDWPKGAKWRTIDGRGVGYFYTKYPTFQNGEWLDMWVVRKVMIAAAALPEGFMKLPFNLLIQEAPDKPVLDQNLQDLLDVYWGDEEWPEGSQYRYIDANGNAFYASVEPIKFRSEWTLPHKGDISLWEVFRTVPVALKDAWDRTLQFRPTGG
mgnify:CR=1 FL=1